MGDIPLYRVLRVANITKTDEMNPIVNRLLSVRKNFGCIKTIVTFVTETGSPWQGIFRDGMPIKKLTVTPGAIALTIKLSRFNFLGWDWLAMYFVCKSGFLLLAIIKSRNKCT